MKKPTIYLDTNIASALHYDGADINALARRMATRDWWDSERRQFELFASIITEQELAQGEYGNQQECLRFVRRLRFVPVTVDVRRLAALFLNHKLVPTSSCRQINRVTPLNWQWRLATTWTTY
jgi:predicted nucleic acid-binding protein